MRIALRLSVAALALLLALAGAAPARAMAAASDPNPLEARIDVDLSKAEIRDVFKTFAQMLSVEVSVDPKLAGRQLSVHLDRVRLRMALDVACETLGCEWTLESGKPPKLVVKVAANPAAAIPDPQPGAKPGLDQEIDIHVTKAKVRDVLQMAAELLSATASLDPKLEGTIDLDLKKIALREALNRICKEVGCKWSLAEGEKPVLTVTGGR